MPKRPISSIFKIKIFHKPDGAILTMDSNSTWKNLWKSSMIINESTELKKIRYIASMSTGLKAKPDVME